MRPLHRLMHGTVAVLAALVAASQTFTFTKRSTKWVRITDLVQDEPLGWCGFTEVQVWGRG